MMLNNITNAEKSISMKLYNDDVVFKTNTGTKYHKNGCGWLKSKIPIKRS
jgi:hypothetical protein